jgi:lycopene cyclase-like protein
VSEQPSLLLLGAGPIGLTAAAEAAAGATSFRCIAPNIDAPWLPNYALWKSDAERLDLTVDLRLTFDTVDLVGLSGSTRTIPLGYGFLNNTTLQRRLRASSDGRWQQGRVEALAEAPDGVTATLNDGTTLKASVVLDARGSRSAQGGAPLPAQTAFGVEIELPSGHPGLPMRFMDWSFAAPAGEPPSFLYSVPIAPGRLFVEETVLSARPAFAIERLRERLKARLEGLGLGAAPWVAGTEEHCYIPMGGLPPAAGGSVIPIGAAAGWVHPASGYLLGHGLGWARDTARVAATGAAATEVWQAAWPADRRRMWALYRFGLDLLLRSDHAQTSAFFEEFFQLPLDRVQAYLTASGSANELASTMWMLFAQGSWPLKRRLAATGLRPEALRLVRELSGD